MVSSPHRVSRSMPWPKVDHSRSVEDGSDLRIVEVGNNILQFKFGSQCQLEWVEKGGPWNFENNLLMLCRWGKGLTATNITFTHTPFWIQVWGLPFEYMTEEAGKDIGGKIGKVIEVDKRSLQAERAKFMRIRVEIVIAKPLRRGGNITNADGDRCWLTFRYERLPTFCYICGLIGHDDKYYCKKQQEGLKERQYGEWLRAGSVVKNGRERGKKKVNGGSDSMVNVRASADSHGAAGFFGASAQAEENRCDSRNSNHEMAVMEKLENQYKRNEIEAGLVKELFKGKEVAMSATNISSVETWQRLVDIPDVALAILKNGTTCDLEVFFGVAWAVWYNRNQAAFESKCHMLDQIWRFARSFLQDYKGALVALNMNPAEKNNRWTSPPPGIVKINVDGATSEDGRNSNVGAVIRDSCGAVIVACGKFLQGQFSVSEVEALAVESGILLARDMNLTQIIVETDALSIVNSINENFIEGSIGHLIQGILALLNSFSSWKVIHVKWDHNRAAHEAAHLARRSEDS
ncbi:hypothetical protein SO802_026306 [Lithocarpus litseifolius]|uniref:RNase H type-1 domain-containing protein n=1 Tax=Lithocarpus litseifolius TaxID=425828 RepID=A0AAW2BZ88_9ROSI